MNSETVKYLIVNQFNNENSPIKNMMLNSGFKNGLYYDKHAFSIKEHNLALEIRTISHDSGIFQVAFNDLMTVEKQLGYPIFHDLEMFKPVEGMYYAREVVEIKNNQLYFRLQSFCLKMSDYKFYIEEDLDETSEIIFDIPTASFINREKVKAEIDYWKGVRKHGFASYIDLYLDKNQILEIDQIVLQYHPDTISYSRIMNSLKLKASKIFDSFGVHVLTNLMA